MVCSDTLGIREEVKNFIQELTEIRIWRSDMPNSFYLILDYSPSALSNIIRAHFQKGRFIITGFTDDKNGWLPNET